MFDVTALSDQELNALYTLVISSQNVDDLKNKILLIHYNKTEHPDIINEFSNLPLTEFYEFISNYKDINIIKNWFLNKYFDRHSDFDGTNKSLDLANMLRKNIITDEEMTILCNNQIYNLEDLVNRSLDDIDGLTNAMREHLSWVRRVYNMSNYEKEGSSKK